MSEVSFDELERDLARIGNAGVGVLRVATRAGAKVLADAERAASPVSEHPRRVRGVVIVPGGMRRSIGYSGMKARTGFAGAKAGLDVGKKDPETGERASHGHLYVQGTDRRYTGFQRVRIRGRLADMKIKTDRSGVKHRGIMPSNLPSFIRTSSEAAIPQMWPVVVQKVIEGIEKAVHRQGL